MVYRMNAFTKFRLVHLLMGWLLCSFASATGVGNLTGPGSSVFGGSDTFLQVEQAYQASFEITDETLHVNWAIAPGYYLYQDKFKLEMVSPTGESTPIEATYGDGIRKFDEYFNKELEVFYDRARITAALDGLPKEFKLKMRSQGCADAGLCYAPRTQYFDINTQYHTAVEADSGPADSGAGDGTNTDSESSLTIAADTPFGTLLLYWMLAAGGGLILNLMPCVFPVLSLKALSFAGTSGASHSHHLHGWAYTAGVVGSFLLAASLILIARTAGESAGWGFQLQSPAFVGFMVYLFLIMGLSLSGMVYFGGGMMGIGQGLTATSGLRGSFFTGVLAAVVASPCTGPLMAPALGFALTQSPAVSLSVFVALGLGMAFPFLLLSYSPRLAQLLPRPGVWMEKLKEILAFPMYLTAAWLLFVFGRQVGMTGLFFLCIGAVALVWAIWLLQNLPERPSLRRILQGVAASAAMFAAYTAYSSETFRTASGDEVWQAFSEERVESLRAEGRTVFVDFTADWCITCKTNKAIALSREGFHAAVAQYDIALLTADWTSEDPEISRVLQSFNRSGVPLYVIYPADPQSAPIVLPQLLTQNMVIEAFQRVAGADKIAKK